MSTLSEPILRYLSTPRCVAWLLSIGAFAGIGAQGSIPLVQVHEEIRIVSRDSVPGMLLTAVEDLVVLPDGRIVTLHRREPIIRVFDPGGRLIKAFGRSGRGPGEFTSPAGVGYVGDRIWVRDVGLGYQLFDGRTYEMIGRVAPGPVSGNFRGLTSDSTSLHTTGLDDSTRVSIYDRKGERLASIDVALRRAGHRFEMEMREINPGGLFTGRMIQRTVFSPLTTYTSLALTPGGLEVVVLEASEIWKGPPGQFTIRRIPTATLRVSAPVTASLPVRRVTPAAKDSLLDELTLVIKGRIKREPNLADEYRERARVPATFPAFMSVVASADGVLWLEQHGQPGAGLVVDRTGRPLMQVQLPRGVDVEAVSRTHLWAITHDADDLPVILRYRIVQP